MRQRILEGPMAGLICIFGLLVLLAHAPRASASRAMGHSMNGIRVDADGVPDFGFKYEPVDAHVHGTDIYYAREYSKADVYRTDAGWFAYCDSKWFRADTWTGPWKSADRSDVPERLHHLPAGFSRFHHQGDMTAMAAQRHLKERRNQAVTTSSQHAHKASDRRD